MTQKPIQKVIEEQAATLMGIEGVVGVGQGLCDGEDCLHVFVVKKTEEIRNKIPAQIDGYQVEIVVTGEFKALDEN